MKVLEKESLKDGTFLHPYYREEYGDICLKRKPSFKADDVCIILFEMANGQIFIEDLHNYSSLNKGYGSAIIRALIKYAINNNCTMISGELSPVDFNHLDKLIYFYKKNLFEVSLNPSGDSGEIKMSLLKPDEILLRLENNILNERLHYLEEKVQSLEVYKKKVMKLEFQLSNESKIIKFMKRFL